jgi:hypothetical protein
LHGVFSPRVGVAGTLQRRFGLVKEKTLKIIALISFCDAASGSRGLLSAYAATMAPSGPVEQATLSTFASR